MHINSLSRYFKKSSAKKVLFLFMYFCNNLKITKVNHITRIFLYQTKIIFTLPSASSNCSISVVVNVIPRSQAASKIEKRSELDATRRSRLRTLKIRFQHVVNKIRCYYVMNAYTCTCTCVL